MVVIAAVGVCSAAFRVNLGLGLVATIIACLALVRAFGVIDREQRAGASLTPRQGVGYLLASLGGATIIVVPSVAVLVACVLASFALAARWGGYLTYFFGTLVGFGLGLVTFGQLWARVWPSPAAPLRSRRTGR
jgi:hypothetical protein